MIIKELVPAKKAGESKAQYVARLMRHYKASRAQVYRWLGQGYAVVREYPREMPQALDIDLIARRTAKHTAMRRGDPDLLDEIEQAVRIKLWKSKEILERANNPEAMAYKAAKRIALNTLTAWYRRANTLVPLEDWLPMYEGQDDDLGDGTAEE